VNAKVNQWAKLQHDTRRSSIVAVAGTQPCDSTSDVLLAGDGFDLKKKPTSNVTSFSGTSEVNVNLRFFRHKNTLLKVLST
jgi:hypothetical protein